MRWGKRGGIEKKKRIKERKKGKSGAADITSGREGGYFWNTEAGSREGVGQGEREGEGEGRERSRCKSTN